MSTFTQAQTAQKLDPTQEFLKEFEARLPKGLSRGFYVSTVKDLLYKVGDFLVMCEGIGISDELVKDVLAHQKELSNKRQQEQE